MMLDAALELARAGLRVFPVHGVVPCTGTGSGWACACARGVLCNSPGKHPRVQHWLTVATTNSEVLRAWWSRWPGANVGAVTGDGRWVLDVDGEEGKAVLAEWVRTCGELPATWSAETGGGGAHYWFEGTAQNRVTRAGVDVRGERGFVVCPPSRHISGTEYVWKRAPGVVPVAAAPLWLREQVGAPLVRSAHAAARGARVPEGGRNDYLVVVAGRLRRAGMSPEALEVELRRVNGRDCDPPLTDDEVAKVASSVARYVPAEEWPAGTGAPAPPRYVAPEISSIQPFRRIDSVPPVFELTVAGALVRVGAEDLLNFGRMELACVLQANLPLRLRGGEGKSRPALQRLWRELVDPALAEMAATGAGRVAAPDDSSVAGVLWQEVGEFCVRFESPDRIALGSGGVLSEGGCWWFTGRSLRLWLSKRADFLPRYTPQELWEILRTRGATTAELCVNGTKFWVWRVPKHEVGNG